MTLGHRLSLIVYYSLHQAYLIPSINIHVPTKFCGAHVLIYSLWSTNAHTYPTITCLLIPYPQCKHQTILLYTVITSWLGTITGLHWDHNTALTRQLARTSILYRVVLYCYTHSLYLELLVPSLQQCITHRKQTHLFIALAVYAMMPHMPIYGL